MVFKGAGARSARGLSEAIGDVGGDLNACTEREGTSFSASLLAEHLPLGIELIADMILAPRFDPADLVREKEVVLQELGEARDTPSDIIFDDLWMEAWPDQPLGRSILGDETSLAAIGLDDLHAWRTGQYRAGGQILVAAGKVDHDALVALAEARFAGLPEGAIDPAPQRTSPAASAPARRGPIRRISRQATPDRPRSTATISRRDSSPTSSAPARRRACSRRCARSAASLIRCGRRCSPIATPACSTFTPRPRGAKRGRRRV